MNRFLSQIWKSAPLNRQITKILCGFWFLVELLGLGFLTNFWEAKQFQQPMLVAFILGLAMYCGCYFSTYQFLPKATRIVFLAILILSLIAQIGNVGKSIFPFVRWSMYSGSHPNFAVVYRYQIQTLNSDHRIEWRPARESITFSEHRVNDALARMFNQDRESYDETVNSLVTLSNKKRRQPIDKVFVEQARVHTWPYQGGEHVIWKPVAQFRF